MKSPEAKVKNAKWMRDTYRIKHGIPLDAPLHVRPGNPARNKLRNRWRHMIDRCHDPLNPQYPGYGGRGIFVCDRWRNSFQAFMDDMGLPPVLAGDIAHRKITVERITPLTPMLAGYDDAWQARRAFLRRVSGGAR